jgi:hypothetical protein
MFQNRHTVFLFVCSIVFIQAIYYIVTLQIKKNDPNLFDSSKLIYNQSSDKRLTSVRPSNNNISSLQVSQRPRLDEVTERKKVHIYLFKEHALRIEFLFRLTALLEFYQQMSHYLVQQYLLLSHLQL